jgi:DNA primase
VIAIEFHVGGLELAKVTHYYGVDDESQGDMYKIICPFHGDNNPSLQINLQDGTFYCYGCGVSGNAVDFVRLAESKKLDDLHVYMRYFRILHSNKVKRITPKNYVVKRSQKDKEVLLAEAHDDYFGLKTRDWHKVKSPEKDYMVKRGFTADSLNLCKAKITYDANYPIMFPMFDNGVFKGWDCRTTTKRIEKKRKYLYNKGFSRRDTLVGDYKSKTVVLVEGYMDWLIMRQNGLYHVAALLGWKITAEQITKLKAEGVEVVISALDNDTCGKRGTDYLANFFNVIRFQFPDGVKDPGDLNKVAFDKAYKKTKILFKRREFYHGISR